MNNLLSEGLTLKKENEKVLSFRFKDNNPYFRKNEIDLILKYIDLDYSEVRTILDDLSYLTYFYPHMIKIIRLNPYINKEKYTGLYTDYYYNFPVYRLSGYIKELMNQDINTSIHFSYTELRKWKYQDRNKIQWNIDSKVNIKKTGIKPYISRLVRIAYNSGYNSIINLYPDNTYNSSIYFSINEVNTGKRIINGGIIERDNDTYSMHT